MEPAGPPTAPKRHRRRIRKLRLTALIGLLLALAFVAFTFGFVRAIASEIPALDPQQWSGEVDGYMYANDGKTILAVLRGAESRVLVDSDQIAPMMKQAIVAIEDRRFYDHRGVDVRGDRARPLGRHPEQGGRPGRLDDHAAVRQERLREDRAHDRAKAQGGGARLAARAAVVEGPDPDRVPEHHLLRERRLRDPAGGARLLRQARRES